MELKNKKGEKKKGREDEKDLEKRWFLPPVPLSLELELVLTVLSRSDLELEQLWHWL